jgi:iron complex outermembrane recepter protein
MAYAKKGISNNRREFMTSRLGNRLSVALLLAAVAQYAATPARAPVGAGDTDQAGQLTEIVVTAQKRAENLQSVPIAITVVGSNALEAAGVISIEQLPNAVAGLAENTTAQYFSPHVRGVGTTSFGPGVENPVALYVDNVYYAFQLQAPTDLINVDQITVLKGPQGTLFGRNASGGVLQLNTREPTSKFGSELRTELDNYLTSRNFAYVTGSVASNLNTNLSLTFTTQGRGWGRNLETGEDIHRIDHDLGVRNKWTWTPSDATTFKLNLDFESQKNSLGPNLIVLHGTTPLFPTGYSSNLYDTIAPVNDWNQYQGGGASLIAEQDLGFARLTNTAAYRRYNFDTYFDTAASTLLALTTGFNQFGKEITDELQLASQNGGKVTWAAGLYYFSDQESITGPIATLYGPAAFLGNSDAFVYDYRLKAQSYAAYGQATATLLPNTHLTLGARYTYEKRSEENGSVTTFVDNTLFPPPATVTPNSFSSNRPTWRVSLDHNFTDTVMAYVSYNRGFKSGGYNALAAVANAPPYKPEQLDAYELGLKTEFFDRSVRVNPAIFYYHYKEIQVTEYTGTTTTILNGASAQLYGLDVDVEWKASSDLSFNGGAEWLHATFLDFPNAPGSVPTPVIGGNTPIVIPNARGNQLPYAPQYTANIGATYTVHTGESKLDLNVTDSYNAGFYSEPDNYLHQASYDYLNAAITWTSGDGMLSLGVWGRNLLDRAVTSQLATTAGYGYYGDYANPPRTAGITVRYKFR